MKSLQKSYLIVEMCGFCDLRTPSANFLHFLGTSKIATLAQNVDHKGAFLGPNQGSIAKKSYKDSQKGVKSCCRPLHEPRLKAFFKNGA